MAIEIEVEGKSIIELRNQLKGLKNDLVNATDPTEMARLAESAGKVRDRMNDINEQVAIFSAGSKFEQAGIALGQLRTDLFNLDFEGAAEKGQKLTALVKSITFTEATKGLKDLGSTFLSLGKALLTNPLFLIPAAITAILGALGLLGPIIDGVMKFFKMLGDSVNEFLVSLGLVSPKIEEVSEAEKKAAEAADKHAESIANEVTGFKLLVAQLKNTNAGSKERTTIIKQINEQYGTTLKNIKDEKKFQEQLNGEVERYLKYMDAKLVKEAAYDLSKKNIKDRIRLEGEIADIKAKQAKADKQTIADENKLNNLRIKEANLRESIDDASDRYDIKTAQRLEAERNAVNRQIAQLEADLRKSPLSIVDTFALKEAEENLKLNKEEADRLEKSYLNATKQVDSFNISIEKTTTSTKSTTNATKELNTLLKEADQSEEDLSRKRAERTLTRIERLEFEKDVIMSNIKKEYEAQKKSIEDTVMDAAKKTAALEALDKNYNRWLIASTTQTQEEIDSIRTESIQKQKKYYEELLLAEQILNEEITFGNNNTSDSLEALRLRKLGIQIEVLDAELSSNKLSVDDYRIKQEEKLILQQQYNDKQRAIDIKQTETEMNFQMGEIQKYYDNMGKYIITKDEETGKYRVDLNDKYLNEVGQNGKKAQDDALLEANSVQNILNKSSENLTEESNVKKEEIEKRFQLRKKKIADDTVDSISEYEKSVNAKTVADRMATFQSIEKIATDLTGMFVSLRQTSIDKERAELDEKHAAELAGLEQGSAAYTAAKERQAKEDDMVARKAFEANKNSQLGAAIMNAALGITSIIAQYPKFDGGIAMAAALISTAAINTAAIAKIASTQYKSSSTGGSSPSGNINGATPQVNLFGNNNNQNTVNATTNQPMMNQNQITVKAVVSETDITDTQKRIAKYRDSAEL